MSSHRCMLRKCQGKRGCVCVKKPVVTASQAPISYSSIKSKPPTTTRSNTSKTLDSGKPLTQPTPTRTNLSHCQTKLPVHVTVTTTEPNQSPHPKSHVAKYNKTEAVAIHPPPTLTTLKANAIASPAPAPTIQSESGIVVLRYNHYRHEFSVNTETSAVKVKDIKETFCFDYGYKGNYKIGLRSSTGVLIKAVDSIIGGLIIGGEYFCELEEDPEIVKARENEPQKTYTANRNHPSSQPTAASADITSQLKRMNASQLREQGAEYRTLLEARDLEDVLYGSAPLMETVNDDDNVNIVTAPVIVLDAERCDSPDSLDKEGAFDNNTDDDDNDDDDDGR